MESSGLDGEWFCIESQSDVFPGEYGHQLAMSLEIFCEPDHRAALQIWIVDFMRLIVTMNCRRAFIMLAIPCV